MTVNNSNWCFIIQRLKPNVDSAEPFGRELRVEGLRVEWPVAGRNRISFLNKLPVLKFALHRFSVRID